MAMVIVACNAQVRARRGRDCSCREGVGADSPPGPAQPAVALTPSYGPGTQRQTPD